MKIKITSNIDYFQITFSDGNSWKFYWDDKDVDRLVEVFEELKHEAEYRIVE